MRTSIILAVGRSAGKTELVAGPEVSLAEQQAKMREALASPRIDQDVAELQHWTSDGGLQRSVKFRTSKQARAEAEQHEKDAAAHKASLVPAKGIADSQQSNNRTIQHPTESRKT